MRTVSIVIVNWNALDVLPACLESLARQQGVELVEVIVIDNDSSDGSVSWLREHSSDFDLPLTVVGNDDNAGFGAANNQGARLATGEILILLNPDTEMVGSDTLSTLASCFDDKGVGLVGPRLLNSDMSTQPSCAALPSIANSFALATGVYKLLPERLKRRVTPGEWSQDESTVTGWLRGACLAFRRADFVALGGFSEATFMYGEDLEIAYEVTRAGQVVKFCAEAQVLHHDDHSANKRWNSAERMRRVAEGDLVFLRRNYPLGRRTAIRALDLAGYLGRWLIHSVRRDPRASTYAAMSRVYLRSWT